MDSKGFGTYIGYAIVVALVVAFFVLMAIGLITLWRWAL